MTSDLGGGGPAGGARAAGDAIPTDGPAGVRLREMTWRDIPRLVELDMALFGADSWSAPTWWAELAGRPRRAYVVLTEPGEAGQATGERDGGTAEAPQRIVGYAGLDLGPEVADVMTIAVDPTRHGRGLGRLLLDWLVRTAPTAGAGRLSLEVRADNEAARRLYAGSGFDVATIRRRYYQPGDVDAVVMRRNLSVPGTPMPRPVDQPGGRP